MDRSEIREIVQREIDEIISAGKGPKYSDEQLRKAYSKISNRFDKSLNRREHSDYKQFVMRKKKLNNRLRGKLYKLMENALKVKPYSG